ncbi:hypothetical protein D7X33_32650 [Butyricicoccus sp. 1XD8-22]|nr:hypothetical protein D7X33_32650 [Butyricicoccus sp. 1XD8-22]
MFYKIGVDFEKKMYVQQVINAPEKEQDLDFYYKNLGCEMIDIVNYSREIAIVVDDEGLLKSNNPVFEVIDANGNKLHLAGNLLFAKNHFDEYEGVSLRGLDAGEAYNLMMELKFKVIGVTR